MTPVALTIAGSDPSGGAGLQADLKTFSQYGVYGSSVVTLLTVQNTQAVSAVLGRSCQYTEYRPLLRQLKEVASTDRRYILYAKLLLVPERALGKGERLGHEVDPGDWSGVLHLYRCLTLM